MKLHTNRWAPHQISTSQPVEILAKTLLFLHGMGGTGQIWRPITAQLEEHFDCIAPDQRGHGQSRPVPVEERNHFHAENYASDVSELLTDLNVHNYYVIGHSMGVRTALALANLDLANNPKKIKGLIAVDIGISAAWGGGIGIPLAEFMENLPRTFSDRAIMKDYLFQHCPDPAIAQYLTAVAKKVSDEPETWVFPFDRESLVETIHQAHAAPIGEWVMNIVNAGTPVLFLRGANSKVWSKSDYEEQKKLYAHPLLQFEEWENCGHGLPFEQRVRFVERVREFVSR